MKEEISIYVNNISKSYKLYEKPIDRLRESLSFTNKLYHEDYYALKNISFSVYKGETVGIIGTNGSGKSTLLKIITRVVTPTNGDVQVNGKVSALLELGAGFNPEYTGLENIYLHGTMTGYSKEQIEAKLNDIITFADIGDFIHQPVKTYSSGMFARLAFAVAINVEPDVLIVDEALSVGDVFFQNKCFKKFEELRQQQCTILFVSHDASSIKQLCSRVLWLEKGLQIDMGDTLDICSKYFNKQIKMRNSMQDDVTVNDGRLAESVVDKTKCLVSFPTISESVDQVSCEDVKILSTFFVDGSGNKVNALFVEEHYTVHILAEFKSPMNNVIGGIVLESNKGVQVLALNSFINNFEKSISVEKPCLLDIMFRFKLPKICRGEYLFSPAIAQGTHRNHVIKTWLNNVGKIQIINEGYNLSLVEIDSSVKIFEYSKENISFE